MRPHPETAARHAAEQAQREGASLLGQHRHTPRLTLTCVQEREQVTELPSGMHPSSRLPVCPVKEIPL